MEIIMASVQNDDMHLNMKVLKATDNYVMGEKEDTRLESDYLILWEPWQMVIFAGENSIGKYQGKCAGV